MTGSWELSQPLGGFEMRQHLTDEKVHYKLYKDGKNLVAASIATGIVIPVALFYAAILSPTQGVEATSNDSNYVTSYGANAQISSLIAQGIKSGRYYDETTRGTSSVRFNAQQLQEIYDAGYVLTVKDNQWEISAPNDKKVNFDTVLSQMGLPNADSDTDTFLASLANAGILTMNGGNEQNVNSGIENTLVSGDGIVTNGNTKLSAPDVTKTIGQSSYTDVISGPLTGLGEGSLAQSFNTLVADGGTLQGTGNLPNGLTSIVDKYSFTDGSMAQTIQNIKAKVEALNQSINSEDVPTVSQRIWILVKQ